MAEKVQKLGLKIDPKLMYFVSDGWVWTVKRVGGGESPSKPARLAKGNFEADDATRKVARAVVVTRLGSRSTGIAGYRK